MLPTKKTLRFHCFPANWRTWFIEPQSRTSASEEIKDIKVQMTIISGKVVWRVDVIPPND